MVHHAYLMRKDGRYAFILATPSASTVDEWWRSERGNAYKTRNLTRESPDFYTYSYSNGPYFELSPQWRDKIFVSMVKMHQGFGRSVPLPLQCERTDCVSRRTYYIRSKSNPAIYWWTAIGGGALYATRKGRTRFRVAIKGHSNTPTYYVMIKSDEIEISSALDASLFVGSSGKRHANLSGPLTVGYRADTFRFGDLSSSFVADGAYDLEKAAVRRVAEGDGEQWELVS